MLSRPIALVVKMLGRLRVVQYTQRSFHEPSEASIIQTIATAPRETPNPEPWIPMGAPHPLVVLPTLSTKLDRAILWEHRLTPMFAAAAGASEHLRYSHKLSLAAAAGRPRTL